MFRSTGARFILVAILTLVMSIPLGLVADIVNDRSRYSDATRTELAREWGGAQLISGPVLVIPVTAEVEEEVKTLVHDPETGIAQRDSDGDLLYAVSKETRVVDRAPVRIYAEQLDIATATTSDIRKRGIFEVPVYRADVTLDFDLPAELADTVLREGEVLDWDAADLRVHLNANTGLRGEVRLEADGVEVALDPLAGADKMTGVFARLGDPRGIGQYRMVLGLNGAEGFAVAATGRTTRFEMTSDWPDPSFVGAFLPDNSEITEAGFSAAWTVPHLARTLPAVSRESAEPLARQQATMAVRFLTPNDFYQKAWRASRYGLLFIGLTFLTILLLERGADRRAHPVQYLMIGLAQAIFVLLMVAYAEQIGFGPAYAAASAATIGLISVYAATGLALGRKAVRLGGVLVVLYGVFFLILRSTDYALLAGSTLAFLALAGTMLMTRNETWEGPTRPLGWPFGKRGRDEAAAT